jgi:hypothetical protein
MVLLASLLCAPKAWQLLSFAMTQFTSTNGKIRPELISTAILLVQRMSLADKERLADEIFRTQPNLLAMVLVQTRFGAGPEEMEGLTNILLTCFTAVKLSTLATSLITEVDQAKCLERVSAYLQTVEARVQEGAGIEESAYVSQHPEQGLLAFVIKEIELHGFRKASDATYGKVVLTALGLVECLSFALEAGKTTS